MKEILFIVLFCFQYKESFQSYSDPCHPTPCGVNTQCHVQNGAAICRCISGYNHAPNSNTIEGCPIKIRPTTPPDPCHSTVQCGINAECRSSGGKAVCECPSGYTGNALVRCNQDPCSLRPCGIQAECSNRGSQAVCSCPHGFQGDPYIRCIENPCLPNPCGQDALCSKNGNRAICSCPSGYTGDPYRSCNRDPCSTSPCGVQAQCQNQGSRAVCSCPAGYSGDPYVRCNYAPCKLISCGQGAECVESGSSAVCKCPHGYKGDPYVSCRKDGCTPNVCGVYATCTDNYGRPDCQCPPGFQGDPYRQCIRGDCDENSDCGPYRICKNYKCVDPCLTTCGVGSDCQVRNHVAICTCPHGTTGDPFAHCRHLTNAEICAPCGQNTNCQVVGTNKPICSCKPNFFGDPLIGCTRECQQDSDCGYTQKCDIKYRCVNVCDSTACGRNANCRPVNHRAECTCPQYYQGNPYTSCYTGCTSHYDCNGNQACIKLECQDPCHVPSSPCGHAAQCQVSNHKPICSCPKGYTGDPYVLCRLEDQCSPNPCGRNAICQPGHDQYGTKRPVCTCPRGYIGDALVSCFPGECERDGDCRQDEACKNNYCRQVCSSACGRYAICKALSHVAVCSCPSTYSGDPLVSCYPKNNRKKRESLTQNVTSIAEN